MKTIFLFPGQGAQYPGMGQKLYDNFSSVRELFRCAGEIAGLDLAKILFEGTEEQLKQTRIAQIGITVVNISVATVLRERGLEAAATAGHSLGEYSALWYAGALCAEATFEAVALRGRLMEQCCCKLQAGGRPAGMAAVLGLGYDEVMAVLKPIQQQNEPIYLANYNAPKQIVIAGSAQALNAAEPKMEAAGAMRYVPLKVSGPFHTPLMKAAAHEFAPFIEKPGLFAQPKIAFYSNVSGKQTSDQLARLAVEQIYSPVLWLKVEEALKADGFGPAFELGPGAVLSGLWKQFLRKEPCKPLNDLRDMIDDFGKLEALFN